MNAVRTRHSSPLSAPHVESQAGQAGKDLFGPAHRKPHVAPVASAQPRSAREATGGSSLSPANRSLFESRFGHDFSRVRIHDDVAAAEAAKEQQARAFTVGNEIYFGQNEHQPDSEGGRELLGHELAHTVQQQNTQGVQRDGKKGVEPAKGHTLGDTPPDEKVDHASGKGNEEEHFTFKVNSADLPADSVKRLKALVEKHKGTLIVKIHGYASEEGGADINFNLGAHRAVALEHALQPLLPPGAKFELYTHGATEAFGARTENRRAGVEIAEGGPAPETDKPEKPAEKWTFDPIKHDIDLHITPRLPSLTAPTYANLPGPYKPTLTIDYFAMRAPFTDRGISLSDRDVNSITDNFNFSVRFLMTNFGLSPDQAATASNALLPLGYDKVLARDSPNQVDKSNQDMDALEKLRGGWHTPNVPILKVIQFLSKDKFKPEF